MLRQEENPGVEFEYSMPSGSVQETPSGGEGYIWSPGPWSECLHYSGFVYCVLLHISPKPLLAGLSDTAV